MLSKTQKMLKLTPSKDNLQEVIFSLLRLIERNTGKVDNVHAVCRSKLEERVLGSYFERMA